MQNLFEKQLSKESVFINKDIISPHHVPERLPFREKQIDDITQGLSAVASSSKPNNLFLYGKTGTGKTSTVKFVLDQLNDFVAQRNLPVLSTYINCRNHSSKYKVLLKAVRSFYPSKDFLGYSSSFVYEKLLNFTSQEGSHIILVLDEIDKVKDIDELVYLLSRGNDELDKGSITLIGISNNLMFKDKLDPRSKSSLCEREMVFSPYNANELKEILFERCQTAFKPGSVTDSAISFFKTRSNLDNSPPETIFCISWSSNPLFAENLNLIESCPLSVKLLFKLIEISNFACSISSFLRFSSIFCETNFAEASRAFVSSTAFFCNNSKCFSFNN